MKLSAIDVLTQIENLLFTNYVRFTSIIDYTDETCNGGMVPDRMVICYRLGKSSIAPLNKSTCIGVLVQKKLEALIQSMIEPSRETCMGDYVPSVAVSYHPQTGVISVRTKFDQDIIDLFFTDSERKTIINFDDYDRVNIS